MTAAQSSDIVVTLRRWAKNANEQGAHEAVIGLITAADEIERLRAERDEARREVCELRCNPPERFIGLPHELAKVNGWDCFPEVAP